MKKKIIIGVIAAMLLASACGNKAEDATNTAENQTAETVVEENATSEEGTVEGEDIPLYEDNDTTPIVDETIEDKGIDAFVKIGDYAGKEFTRTIMEVTDEDAANELQNELQWNPMLLPEDTVIEPGMVADINYKGSVDGEYFEGGEYEGYDLEIGSGQFIEGFEEQLVGHKAGDEFEIKVTFPEDYMEDLAGKEAVFEIKVNGVKEILEEPNDEWVKANTDYETAEEYLANFKDDLYKLYNSGSETEVRADAWNQVMEEAEFIQYPKDIFERNYNDLYEQVVTKGAENEGMTEEDYMTNYGIDEGYVSMLAKENVKTELLARAVLEKEGAPAEGEEVDKAMKELVKVYGYESLEDLNFSEAEKNIFRVNTLSYYAAGFIVNKGTVKEVPYEAPDYEFYGEEDGMEIIDDGNMTGDDNITFDANVTEGQ